MVLNPRGYDGKQSSNKNRVEDLGFSLGGVHIRLLHIMSLCYAIITHMTIKFLLQSVSVS